MSSCDLTMALMHFCSESDLDVGLLRWFPTFSGRAPSPLSPSPFFLSGHRAFARVRDPSPLEGGWGGSANVDRVNGERVFGPMFGDQSFFDRLRSLILGCTRKGLYDNTRNLREVLRVRRSHIP